MSETTIHKVAPYQTDGRLFTIDISANLKLTRYKIYGKYQKSGPCKFRYCALV